MLENRISANPGPVFLSPVAPRSILAERVLRFYSSGGRLGTIIGPSLSGKTALLTELAAAFQGPVFKVANPLKAQLNLARIMVQIDVTDDGGDDAALLTEHLAGCAGPDTPAVLMIDDAHTLDDEALRWLAGLAGHAFDGPEVQILLAARPEIEPRLTLLGFESLRNPLRVTTFLLPGLECVSPEVRMLPFVLPMESTGTITDELLPSSSSLCLLEHEVQRADPTPRKSRLTPILLATLLLGAVGAGTLVQQQHPEIWTIVDGLRGTSGTALTIAEAETPTALVPLLEAAAAPASSLEAVAPIAAGQPAGNVPDTALRQTERSDDELRQDFRTFLTRSGRSAFTREPAQFEDLFQSYLQWRSSTPR